MRKIRVGVAGYGTIGQRLADGVAMQEDMELVGVADLAPTLAVRALYEKGMPYDLYLVDGANSDALDSWASRCPAPSRTCWARWTSCWTPPPAAWAPRTRSCTKRPA